MFRLVMFYTAADLGAALTAVAAVADQSITIPASGTGIIVPSTTSKLAGAFGVFVPANTLQCQIQAPSLRTRTYPTIEPLTVGAAVAANPMPLSYWGETPTDLEASETLQVFVNSNAATAQYVGVLLSDGPTKPVAGKVQSVRFTSTVQAAAATWAAGTVTLDQQLPTGRYRVVGLRTLGTGLVAARLIFDDMTPRPGILCPTGIGGLDAPHARFGRGGAWGDFDSTNPPKIEVIGGTAAAQTGILDLVKV